MASGGRGHRPPLLFFIVLLLISLAPVVHGKSTRHHHPSIVARRRDTTTAAFLHPAPPSSSSSSNPPSVGVSCVGGPMMSSSSSSSSLHASSSSSMKSSSTSSPRDLIREGMRSFRAGDVSSSLSYFDAADDIARPSGSLTPYLWQRGICYYYLNRYVEGHEQFRTDVNVNPNDVEEIVWDIACLARMRTNDDDATGKYPPDGKMALPRGARDARRIMSEVYSLFRGDGATEWDLRRAGCDANASSSDEFYSLFYLGLYCEIRNEPTKAEAYMRMASTSEYATGIGSGDYMSSCSKVHCMLRNWV